MGERICGVPDHHRERGHLELHTESNYPTGKGMQLAPPGIYRELYDGGLRRTTRA